MDFQAAFSDLFAGDYDKAAEFFGVSSRTVYRWVNGEVQVPLAVLKLCEYESKHLREQTAESYSWSFTATGLISTPMGYVDPYQVEFMSMYLSTIDRQRVQIKILESEVGADVTRAKRAANDIKRSLQELLDSLE